MPDLEVVTEDIRAAGDSAHAVVDAVRSIEVSAVGAAAAAMPGAKAAALFGRLEGHLDKGLATVADGFAGIADAMRSAADLYEANEEAAIKAMAVPYAPEPGI